MPKKAVLFNNLSSDYQHFRKKYQKIFDRVMSSGMYILSENVDKFEYELANYLDVKHVIGVGNGLEALQIALMALGVQKNDEVITTPLSAVATTLAIVSLGAIPVFVDTTPEGQLDASFVEISITSKTKAILPVNLYGAFPDYEMLCKIGKKYNIHIVEDAAQSLGSLCRNTKLGSFGHMACFSFYPTKNLGAIGDGGAIVTNNNNLAELCRSLRNYGQTSKYVHTYYGLNSRLDELQAAFLRFRLKHLDLQNKKRHFLAKQYDASLQDLDSISPLINPSSTNTYNYHLYVIKSNKRDELQDHLKKSGIPTHIHYPQLIVDQPFIKSFKFNVGQLNVAQKLTSQILSLPIHPDLTAKQQEKIIREITNFQDTLK